MYDLIDQLVDLIRESEIFNEYLKANEQLKDEQVQSILEKHQLIQEEYMRLKQYESYIPLDEIKNELKEIKKEMTNNQIIQNYYQRYYELNELLDDLCQMIFKDISDEIVLKRY